MATIPVVVLGAEEAVLSLIVDDATRLVTGYTLVRASNARPVEVFLTSGAFTFRQTVGVGNSTGSIPRNRQWNYDTATGTTYELAAR